MTEITENPKEIYENLKHEARELAQQIAKIHNPFRRHALIREYLQIMQLLRLKPKRLFKCRCGKITIKNRDLILERQECVIAVF